MKEIEFRVWDPEHKRMITQEMLDDFDQEISSYFNQEPVYYTMQYTGLKDKNGVKIFEGDVVLHHDWNNKYRNDFQVLEIGTEDGPEGRPSILPCLPHQQMCTVYDFSMEASQLEVIGNIHQNPELIDNIK